MDRGLAHRKVGDREICILSSNCLLSLRSRYCNIKEKKIMDTDRSTNQKGKRTPTPISLPTVTRSASGKRRIDRSGETLKNFQPAGGGGGNMPTGRD